MIDESIPTYGSENLLYSVEPLLLKKKDALFIEKTLTHLLKEAETFTADALKNPSLLKRLGLPSDLCPEPTPLGLHIPFARFDFLFDGKDLKVLELNTDGTSGFNVTEWLSKKAMIPDDQNPNLDLSKRLYNAILEHAPKSPEVVLLDFSIGETSWEQRDLINSWKKFGAVKLADPSSRTWVPGSLIYRRALSWQLRQNKEKAKPFLDDWSEKKVTVVGGWSSDVGMSKAWPAITKSTEFPETEIINKFLVRRLKDEKDQWVLKGAMSYAGKAVLRGSDISQEKWVQTLSKVLDETQNDRPWIAQRKIEIPLFDGKPCEFGMFFLNGIASGYMGRWGHLDPISDKSLEIMRPVQVTSL